MGGVLEKKRDIHTEDTTSHGENKKEKKKKGKKKEKKKGKKKEVPSIELANFDSIFCWFHPLRYSGMN